MSRSLLLAAFLSPALLGSCVVALGGCGVQPQVVGSGLRVEERRTLEDFDRLGVGGSFVVRVRSGDAPGVLLRGDDNLLPHVRTTVREGRLTLEFEGPGSFRSERPIEVELSTPSLRAISVSGGCQLEASALEAANFALNVSGSCTGRLAGRVGKLELNISGSARLDLLELLAQEAQVQLSGSGQIDLAAEHELDVSVSGSGRVRYLGQPQVSSRISGSGSVTALAD